MKHKSHRLATIALIGFGMIAASSASAQGFTLFGDPSPKPPAEQKTVRPLTAPYFHEDSFVTTDIRPWFVDHHFYSDTIGGDAQVYAVQFRLAVTSQLQLVVYKGGYLDFNDTMNDEGGWNDHAIGLKWAFIQDWENQFHMAAGVGYQFPIGDSDILQDTEEIRLWLSANKGFGRLHLGATLNYRIAGSHNDGNLGSSDMITAHLHADYFVNEWFSPVVEINGYFVTDEGPGTMPFSGVDAASIAGGKNEDTVTGAIGAEFRPFGPDLGIRGAYETQLTDNQSLFGHRWTISAVYEF
ncbi:MAG TPA: hypothetical protein VK041_02000 [Opitutales bacterium]|nr:hypothetical protein [Opitutales bacterium]